MFNEPWWMQRTEPETPRLGLDETERVEPIMGRPDPAPEPDDGEMSV